MSYPVYKTVQQYVRAARRVSAQALRIRKLVRRSPDPENHPVHKALLSEVSDRFRERSHYMRQARALKAMQEAVREARAHNARLVRTRRKYRIILNSEFIIHARHARDSSMRRAWRMKARLLAAMVDA